MRMDDVRRLDLGTFVRPATETGTSTPQVEPVLAYTVPLRRGVLLFDSGIGDADPGTEAHYRPRRIPLPAALAGAGLHTDDVMLVVSCHLHFDHIGGNRALVGRPVVTQGSELALASAEGYTVPELVDFPGARYEELDGAAELAPGIRAVPTPGHTAGHQSLVITCEDGVLVLAGQAHDTASQWSADALAAQAPGLGHVPPLPTPSPWMSDLLTLGPRRVLFAHDRAVWQP